MREKLIARLGHRRRSVGVLPAIVFALGLCLSMAGAKWLDFSLDAEARAELRRHTNRVAEEVSRRFREPVHGMEGARGLYSARGRVTRAEFRAYVESRDLLREFPGVLGFGFIQHIGREGLEEFAAAQRADGAPLFAVHELQETAHADLYVVKYIEPEARNVDALGLDLGSHAVMRGAAEQAIRSGEPTLTAPMPIGKHGKNGLGFLLYLPVFRQGSHPTTPEQRRADLEGLMYSPLAAGDLLAGIYEVEARLLNFELADSVDGAPSSEPVFDSSAQMAREVGGAAPSLHSSRYELARPVSLPGRELTLQVHSTPKFEAAYTTPLPWLAWGAGTLASALLASLLGQRAASRLRAQKLANIIDATQVGTWECNVRTGEIHVDELWARQLGYTAREMSSIRIETLNSLTHPDDKTAAREVLQRHFTGGLPYYEAEVRLRHKDGRWVWMLDRGRVSERTVKGKPVSMHGTCMDITARRHAELEVQHRAFHDKLTGLPNRERFYETLRLAIADANSGLGRAFAVMFLDFDRFKLINDSHGHGVGDEFLEQASARLAHCLRSGDMLARMGGDEFAVLAVGLNRDTDAAELAERLLLALRDPLQLTTMAVTASASIGITFSSIGYTHPADMLRDADIAMYRAKAEGKARYALFDVQLHAELADRVWLEAELRLALPQQALSLAYQPLVDLRTGQVKGFEALSRWTHPVLGQVSPATFIPIAEESGLITQLTDGVVRSACAQLRAWQREYPRLDDLHLHVNASARDVADPEFVARIRQALQSCGLAPRNLVIELTENILMTQLSAAMGTLQALRELGVGLSVDDFGAGYSSLSHLSMLPIDSLKIDMSFVKHLRAGSKEAAVVRAIVLLGTSLGKQVIAEGIETISQMELLRDLGCDVGQGYYMSRPLSADCISQMLQDQQTQPGTPTTMLLPASTVRAACVLPKSRPSLSTAR
ncbi:MAG: EAL domain-containing protein [Rubrivivax sp.]|nr:EAL domain-containing protein [Rubrivivax sp.]